MLVLAIPLQTTCTSKPFCSLVIKTQCFQPAQAPKQSTPCLQLSDSFHGILVYRLQHPPPHLHHGPVHKSRSITLQRKLTHPRPQVLPLTKTILRQTHIINKERLSNRHSQLHPSQLRANAHPRSSAEWIESLSHSLRVFPSWVRLLIDQPSLGEVEVWIGEMLSISMQSIQRSANDRVFGNDMAVDHGSAISNTARHEVGDGRRQTQNFFEAAFKLLARIQLFASADLVFGIESGADF